MDLGQLNFARNNEDYKIAYENEIFKKGPIYPIICFY